MPILSLPRTWRHIRRYRKIISVLIKYGFSDVVDAARNDLILRFGEKIIPSAIRRRRFTYSRAERIRAAIEELGPTFIKMGQILSLRPDLIPPEISTELQKLQDDVTPVPWSVMEPVVNQELGCDWSAIFSTIDEQPLANASIAQVHRARLPDNRNVVLKIQRPGTRTLIETDLEILRDLVLVLQRYLLDILIQDPLSILDEFDKSIHRELDFRQEGQNILRFRRNFENDPAIFIPDYYTRHSTSRLLIMDFVEGIKISHLDQLVKEGYDLMMIARRGTQLSFRQIFDFGFFHADPHPGNLMVLSDNVIAPIDFGMIGQMDELTIDHLGNIVIAIVRKDTQRLIRAFEHLDMLDVQTDLAALRADLSILIENYYGVSLRNLLLSNLLNDFYTIVQRYRIRVPVRLSLAFKALLTAEGVARLLNPDFDFIQEMQPYLQRIIARRYDLRRRWREGLVVLDDLALLAEEFPQKTRQILTKAANGTFSIRFMHHNLEYLVSEVSQAANRIISALIIAALIVGSSLVFHSAVGPALFGQPIIALVGYGVAGILGLRLILTIIHKR